MTDKEILQKWCATYGENDEDIRATMWGEDLMIEFAKQYHKEQLILSGVSDSLPTKEEMNSRVNELIFQNFEEDEISSRREYGFGFRACYRWIVKDLKHK